MRHYTILYAVALYRLFIPCLCQPLYATTVHFDECFRCLLYAALCCFIHMRGLFRVLPYTALCKVFFDTDGWIFNNIDNIGHIPCVIIQGRYDVVCPMISAWDLHKVFPEADFKIIQDAGHSMTELGIASKLIEYSNRYVNL